MFSGTVTLRARNLSPSATARALDSFVAIAGLALIVAVFAGATATGALYLLVSIASFAINFAVSGALIALSHSCFRLSGEFEKTVICAQIAIRAL